MENMVVQVEICARKFVWRVNKIIKPMIFCDILYHLNAIFLQCVFEVLKCIFRYLKTKRIECYKERYIFSSQIKELRDIFLMV
jgi:hypothetical protein